MKIPALLLLLAVICSPSHASDWNLVGSHSDATGAITIYVMDSGLHQEKWKFEVSSYSDGEQYTFEYHTAGSVLHVQGSDISGYTTLSGASGPFFAATLHTQEFPGVQLHSNGHYYFPPGVRPPTHIQTEPDPGASLWSWTGLGFRRGDEVIQGCLGAVFSALGSYIGTGGAWRAGLTGFSRGTMSLNLATAGLMAAGSIAIGATLEMITACR